MQVPPLELVSCWLSSDRVRTQHSRRSHDKVDCFCPFMYGAAGGGITGRFHGNPVTLRAIASQSTLLPRIHLAGASRPQVALIAARIAPVDTPVTGHT